MIIIKDLLFKLLDEIEPNDLLELKIDKQYNNIYVANKQSILPLAIEMRVTHEDDTAMEEVYRGVFFQNEISKYEQEYVADHTVVLNENKYVVVEELIDIQYFDEYFSVTVANPHGISTYYLQYSNISSIRVRHECSDSVVKEYNSLNYRFKSNK